MKMDKLPFQLACPACHTPLIVEDTRAVCPQDGRIFQRKNGIWGFLLLECLTHYAQFMQEYETVRLAEGRHSDDPAYYRALPWQDLSGRMTAVWQIRATSFRTLLHRLVEPLAAQQSQPLRILDVGAGNGWLAYQLAKSGHNLAAIDLTTNAFDGLGVHTMYDAAFCPIQAEFGHLPLAEAQADLTIFNAAFHYAERYEDVLAEAWRVTQPEGLVIVLDSPLYRQPENGRRMVREREAAFQKKYGFRGSALASENFLTFARITQLAQASHTSTAYFWPVPRWRQLIRTMKVKLRRQREPAQFPLVAFAKNPAVLRKLTDELT